MLDSNQGSGELEGEGKKGAVYATRHCEQIIGDGAESCDKAAAHTGRATVRVSDDRGQLVSTAHAAEQVQKGFYVFNGQSRRGN